MTGMTEDEQLAVLKEWWQRNGKPLLIGGCIALCAVVGWNFWQSQVQGEAQKASDLYQELLTAALTESKVDVAKVAHLGQQLKNDFPETHYAQYAGLFLARVAVDAQRLTDAAAELRPIIEKPAAPELKELARQRLAQIWSAQNEPQRGLDLLSGGVDAVFAASREELRGDLLLQLGREDEAKAAYLKAQEAQGANVSVALQLKLDDLAREAKPSDA